MGGATSRHQISEGSALNVSLLRDPDWQVRVCECISFHLVKTAICFRLCVLHRTKVGRPPRPEQVAAPSVAVVGLVGEEWQWDGPYRRIV